LGEFHVNCGAHTKLTDFSPVAFTAVCCDDVMTPDEGHLLVVEDEPFLRKAVAAALRFLGFRVTAAENGTDALRLARNRRFDLLVLDVMLPGIDGFEIAAARRREPGSGDLPDRERHPRRQGHRARPWRR
jgi:hypothetical protein